MTRRRRRMQSIRLTTMVIGGWEGSNRLSPLKSHVIHIYISFINTYFIPILYFFHVNLIFTLMSTAFFPWHCKHKVHIWHKNTYDMKINAYDLKNTYMAMKKMHPEPPCISYLRNFPATRKRPRNLQGSSLMKLQTYSPPDRSRGSWITLVLQTNLNSILKYSVPSSQYWAEESGLNVWHCNMSRLL